LILNTEEKQKRILGWGVFLFQIFIYKIKLFIIMYIEKLLETAIHEYLNEQQEVENKINYNVFYHGSKYPKLKFMTNDNNIGKQLFGYGFYVSLNREESLFYYSLSDNTDGYLYTITTDNLNFVDWYKPVSNEIISKVKKIPNFMNLFYYKPNFNDLNFNDYEYNIGDVNYDWDEVTEPLPQWVIDNNGKAGYFLTVEKGGLYKTYYGLTKNEILNFIKNANVLGVKELKIPNPNLDNIIITKDNLFDSFGNLYWYLFLKLNSTKKTSEFFKDMGVDAFYINDENINIINVGKIKSYKKEEIYYKSFF
jgi:hypothetical protein